MNINENIRNKRKMVDNLKGCTYTIAQVLAANALLDVKKYYQMKVESEYYDTLV